MKFRKRDRSPEKQVPSTERAGSSSALEKQASMTASLHVEQPEEPMADPPEGRSMTNRAIHSFDSILKVWLLYLEKNPLHTKSTSTRQPQYYDKHLAEALRLKVVAFRGTSPALYRGANLKSLPTSGPYQGQINEILSQQGLRMTAEEKKCRALAADSRKRPSSTVGEPTDNKQIKLDSEAPTQASNSAASAAFLTSFDFTSLSVPLITNLIVANLEAFTEAQLISKVNAYRQSHGPTSLPMPRLPTAPELVSSTILKAATAAATPSAPQQDLYVVEDTTTTTLPASEPIVKAESVDPLQMNVDEDELEYEPEKLNEALSGTPVPEDQTMGLGPLPEMTDLQLMDFKLPPLKEWSEEGRSSVVSSSVTRIWEDATELHAMGESIPPDSSQAGGHSASEMWMLLLIRMITRVAEPPPEMEADETSDMNKALVQQNYYLRQDKLRHTLCEYVMADFPSRQVFQKLCIFGR
ncbi:hypothetical protein CPB84DRAFT_1848663 [Gymnopilus junonius]|uniref:Uncharacterized protein n=1 Tax=Gymnopilus junonius TaxID=109634 RepID=A0A9P5NJR4_GYMJU|nr:hypothetical protein CPB84DRAFT_1848663 [Gymnopilus junonius]